jgi:hypothetical protein
MCRTKGYSVFQCARRERFHIKTSNIDVVSRGEVVSLTLQLGGHHLAQSEVSNQWMEQLTVALT